jgi:hypothetical protein
MSAVISEDGLYRYLLTRGPEPTPSNTTDIWVMLNPSTADADTDDPTIRRVVSFAENRGHERVVVANLFAYRATRPHDLLIHGRPVGADNKTYLSQIVAGNRHVVVAWGTWGERVDPDMVKWFCDLCKRAGTTMWCLGTNKDGSPKHPLYVAGAQEFVEYHHGR